MAAACRASLARVMSHEGGFNLLVASDMVTRAWLQLEGTVPLVVEYVDPNDPSVWIKT